MRRCWRRLIARPGDSVETSFFLLDSIMLTFLVFFSLRAERRKPDQPEPTGLMNLFGYDEVKQDRAKKQRPKSYLADPDS